MWNMISETKIIFYREPSMHAFILWIFREPSTERAQSVLKLNLPQCLKGLLPLKLKETLSFFAADAEHNQAECISKNKPLQSGRESPQQICGDCNIWFKNIKSQNTPSWKGPLRIIDYNSLLLAKLHKNKQYHSIAQALLELWLDWCATTSLGNPGTTTSLRRFHVLCSIWTSSDASWFHFIVSWNWSPERGDQHCPSLPPWRKVQPLLFSKLNKAKDLTCSLHVLPPSPFTMLISLL